MAIAEERGFRRPGRRVLAALVLITVASAQPNAVCGIYCAIGQLRASRSHVMVMARLPCHSGRQSVHRPAVPPPVVSAALPSAILAIVPPAGATRPDETFPLGTTAPPGNPHTPPPRV